MLQGQNRKKPKKRQKTAKNGLFLAVFWRRAHVPDGLEA